MNNDGSGVSSLGGKQGTAPVWSPDGRQVAFTSVDGWQDAYVMHADGSNAVLVGVSTGSPAWMPASTFATFSTDCRDLVCSFDGSWSMGAITDYRWQFGDTASASGRVVSHTFAEGGTYAISLVVTDANGVTANEQLALRLNRPPIASFTASCTGLACTFDASGSSDSDGVILNHTWNFGDGSEARSDGATMTHLFSGVGTFAVILTVSDNSGTIGTHSRNVTIPGVHVGDLDGLSTPGKSSWTASVVLIVHDDAHHPVVGATVSGSWSNSPGTSSSCRTADTGTCTITGSTVPSSIGSLTFNVVGVISGTAFYDALRNHDVDGETNGITVTVRKR